MVQVLDYVPSFSERLGPVIQQAGSTIGQAFQQHQSKKKDDMLWQQLQNPEIQNKPLDLIGIISKFSPERRKSLETLYGPLLTQKQKSADEIDQINRIIGNSAAGAAQSQFDNQFRGGMPQQEGDNQNIKPSTTTSPSTQVAPNKPISEGGSPLTDEQLAPLSGLSGAAGKAAKSILENRHSQRKEVTESFKENKEFINKSHGQYEDAVRRDAILDRMIQLDDSGELSDSGAINLLETLGLKEEWLKNPANEEYTKLSLDLLGGGTLQADYGNRILQSEFQVSEKRIPALLQTKEGRRQIVENIRTMLLPSKLKHDRLQYYIDKSEREGKPLPHDVHGKVLRDIKPQLEEAADKFKQRNGRYKVKDGSFPDDSALEKYYFLSNGDDKKAFKMMKEDGYDVES